MDTDLRKPRQHRLFEIPKEPGFSDLVVDQRDAFEDYLRSTSVENLWLLPCGTVPPNPAELLSSLRAAEVMEQLKEHADVVVYDSPPAGTVTDAVVMASRVDAVLQVVQAGRTRRDLVVRGRELLEKAGARVLGPVLNRVSLSDLGYYSYYYYYGYYRDGDGRESKEPSGLRRLLPRRWGRSHRKRRSTERVAEERITAFEAKWGALRQAQDRRRSRGAREQGRQGDKETRGKGESIPASLSQKAPQHLCCWIKASSVSTRITNRWYRDLTAVLAELKEVMMVMGKELDLEAMDRWYATHFEELVMKFAGKAIAVIADEIVAVADTEKEADQLARERHPDALPLVLAIPTEEELVCLL